MRLSGALVALLHAVPYFLVRTGAAILRHSPDIECRSTSKHLIADLPAGGALALCVVGHTLI